MVIFDSNFFLTLLKSVATGPECPNSGKPLPFHEERVQGLFDRLDKAGEVIGIPAPVIAEVGIRDNRSVEQLVATLSQSSRFKILPFDGMAAIECSLIAREGHLQGDKRFDTNPNEVWNKVKYDRQILAIAIVNQATTLYTWDGSLMKMAKRHGIATVSIFDLAVPDEARQLGLDMAHEEVLGKSQP